MVVGLVVGVVGGAVVGLVVGMVGDAVVGLVVGVVVGVAVGEVWVFGMMVPGVGFAGEEAAGAEKHRKLEHQDSNQIPPMELYRC